jgi:sulfur carrier protein ThiS
MPDCTYCREGFDDEEAYLRHLRDEHREELSRIDERRVESGLDEETADRRWLYAAAVVVLLVGAAGVYTALGGLGAGAGGGGGSPSELEPQDPGSRHYHGSVDVRIDDRSFDFGRDRWQLRADCFHFEGNQGNRWHVHCQDVTLSWAMDSLGFNVTAGTLAYDGTTYRDAASGTSVAVRVDGEPVNPAEYVLQEGDSVEIVVETGG